MYIGCNDQIVRNLADIRGTYHPYCGVQALFNGLPGRVSKDDRPPKPNVLGNRRRIFEFLRF